MFSVCLPDKHSISNCVRKHNSPCQDQFFPISHNILIERTTQSNPEVIKYYACIIWNANEEKQKSFETILKDFKEFKIVHSHYLELPADKASEILYRMYDYHVERPWQTQIAALAGCRYLLVVLSSQDETPDQWILTRGGVTKGSRRLMELKELYRALHQNSWLSLHTSINQTEASRDIYTHLGLCLANHQASPVSWPSNPAPSIPGIYSNEEDFHSAIKSYGRCCLIASSANFFMQTDANEHNLEHYSLLVDDPKNAANFFGLQSGTVWIDKREQKVSFIGIHSGTMCPVWANTIIDSSRQSRHYGLPVPAPDHHFFSFAYFVAISQRGLTYSSAYFLLEIARRGKLFYINSNHDEIPKLVNRILRRFMISSGYTDPSSKLIARNSTV